MPDTNYIMLDIQNIDPLGDALHVCWNKGYVWDIVVHKSKVLESKSDTARFRYRTSLPLNEIGVPTMRPIGGHAVYVDARAFYDHIPVDQYPGQALAVDLYLKGGIRAVEIGSVMFGKYDDKGELIPAPMELVRIKLFFFITYQFILTRK